MLFIAVAIILALSFILALWSLKRELSKQKKEIEHTKKELMKEKVLFIRE